MISVHVSGFVGGALWLLIAAGVAVSDLLAYRRRVTTRAVCVSVHDEPEGIVRHHLERVPVTDERRSVLFRTKGPSVGVGRAVTISYDPKRDHEVFLADRHPRISWQPVLALAGIGVALIVMGLIP
ncbi:hypothetical protein EKH77_13920 [Streptomyces luteoverticillatus]|uniref:DUF3592 domain-containing protein n=1 Tax=Streptomyces luteoverticillatus TaxID=66425 RepID=A0A3Q9FW87_STRLT|nr:hypothetical protein [Streptomyces luteoverticillatus]AZQ72167.1 hypothetical protein EKH77_13920 [Streptomyces luteoverticillatus]